VDQSEVALFTTALINPTDWKAQWITGGKLLEGVVKLEKPVKRARVFVAAAGYYELRVNNHRIGNHVLDPAWTEFDRRMLYAVYDVTAQVENTTGFQVLMSRGWFGKDRKEPPRVLLQLQGEYTDGTRFLFGSGPDWYAEAALL
jgi:alpha-L-rhamnosidase